MAGFVVRDRRLIAQLHYRPESCTAADSTQPAQRIHDYVAARHIVETGEMLRGRLVTR
jgi:hypothetical protein